MPKKHVTRRKWTLHSLAVCGEREVTALGIGPMRLDVEAARAQGWSDEEIAEAFEVLCLTVGRLAGPSAPYLVHPMHPGRRK